MEVGDREGEYTTAADVTFVYIYLFTILYLSYWFAAAMRYFAVAAFFVFAELPIRFN